MENSSLFSTALEQTAYLLILGKMLLALVLGGIIGLERELKHKPVGVKTCAIIAVTTCVLTIVSIQAAEHYAAGRWLHQDDGLRHRTLLPRTEPDRQRQGHRLGALHQP